MKKALNTFLILMIVVSSLAIGQNKSESLYYKDVRIKEIPMAMQCWTFRKFTFMETLPKVEALGIKILEAFPGQKIYPNKEATMGPGMSDEDIKAVKDALKKHSITLKAFGVTNFDPSKEAARPTFEFAKTMGIKIIVIEPKYDDYKFIEELVKEYNIKIAVHNHAKPSKYWNPETVLTNVRGLDKRIGVCGDTGHWLRSGIDPVDAIRLCGDRMINMHLKDLDQFGIKEAQDVPFGSGKANVHDILAELTLQGYSGSLSVEHERGSDAMNPSPPIKKGLEYIESITYYKGYTAILGNWNGNYHKHGWNHYGPGYFSLDRKSGVLTSDGGMGLFWYSAQKFEDFVLDLEFKCHAPNTNSGVFYRIPEVVTSNDYIHHSFEVQIFDNAELTNHTTAAVYDAEAAKLHASNAPGEWNHYVITVIKDEITVELNGIEVNKWKMEPRGKIRDFALKGYIALQNHDSDAKVSYRNIFVKELK